MITMPISIKITQRDDYEFPQPKYGFGQTVIDKDGEPGFIVGMQFTLNEWEYQIFFTQLEVLGADWYGQSELSLEVVEV